MVKGWRHEVMIVSYSLRFSAFSVMARFAGKSLIGDFIDRLDSTETLWEMIEQAEDFFRKNIRLFGFRTGISFKRIDKLAYPIRAIREGAINALRHRDYREHADRRILIFDDRIEITNPGRFPEGTSLENPRHIPEPYEKETYCLMWKNGITWYCRKQERN